MKRYMFFLIAAAFILSCSSTGYKPLPYGERLLVAVGEVENRSGNPLFDAAVSDSASYYIHHLHATRCFRVIERERLGELLDEHSLSMSGLIDQSQGRRIGKILGVDAILYLTLSSARYSKNERVAGSAVSVEESIEVAVDARLVAVETGEILASASSKSVEEAKVQSIGSGLSRGEAMDQVKTVRDVVTRRAAEELSERLAAQVYAMSGR